MVATDEADGANGGEAQGGKKEVTDTGERESLSVRTRYVVIPAAGATLAVVGFMVAVLFDHLGIWPADGRDAMPWPELPGVAVMLFVVAFGVLALRGRVWRLLK